MDKLRSDLKEDREDLWQEVEDVVGHQYQHPFSLGERSSYYVDMDLKNFKEKNEAGNYGKIHNQHILQSIGNNKSWNF